MSCCISIRACPKPNDFFDEIIPEEGLRVGDWLLTIHRIPAITTKDGQEVEVDIRWVYAETNCAPEHLKSTLHRKRLELRQIFRALSGVRQRHIEGDLDFTMWFDEYINEGVRGNIVPHSINIGIRILNVRHIDKDGNVISDARAEAFERSREKAQKELAAAKIELKNTKYIRFLGDPFFCRAFESYSLALAEDDHAIGHLYDIREAAEAGLGNAKKLLEFSENEWSRFGKTLNDRPVKGGRHNGKKPGPMRTLTEDECTFLFSFAKKLLDAYGKYLESKEKDKQGQLTES
ncbi:TPA: hypothetical protein ACQTXI_003010 [Pseudomonas aeruginosa]